MIRCPKPGEPTPWDLFPKSNPKTNPKGGLIKTLFEILTGDKKMVFDNKGQSKNSML